QYESSGFTPCIPQPRVAPHTTAQLAAYPEGAVAVMSARAARGGPAEYPRRDQQDDDRPNQGTEHAAPVEDVRVADAEANREAEGTDEGCEKDEPDENQ